MEPSFPSDDASLDELRNWLRQLADSELDAYVEMQPVEVESEIDSIIESFASATSYMFGWALSANGDYDVVAGWVPIPQRSVAGFGGVDAADDMVEIAPIGSPALLNGILARWSTYNQATLSAAIAIRTDDGEEWPLVATSAGRYEVELPIAYAHRLPGDGVAQYEIVLEAIAAPLAADIRAITDVEIVIQRWAKEMTSITGPIFRGSATDSNTWQPATIAPDQADHLGIARFVDVQYHDDYVVVRVQPLGDDRVLFARSTPGEWIRLEYADGYLTGRLPIAKHAHTVHVRFTPG